jgi:hypothetical protein
MLNVMKNVTMLVLCLVTLFPAQTAFAQTVRNDQVAARSASNGGPWGSWTNTAFCPANTWAAGYTMRVEASQGSGDDTALNAVALYCYDRAGRYVATVYSHTGYWGQWVTGRFCAQGAFFTYFRLKREASQGSGDDTSANSVGFWCSNGVGVEGAGGPWGTYGSWQGGFTNAAVCGIAVRVESPQGSGDDTALNNVQLTWCRR